MLIFKFLLAVGAVLTSGLFALSAYLEPVSASTAMRVSVAPTTASLQALAPPVKQVRLPEPAAAPAPTPPKNAAKPGSKERTRRAQM
jgi:hypothetical protein